MDGSEWIDLDEQTNLGTEWKSFKILCFDFNKVFACGLRSQACDDSKEELPCNAEPCPEDRERLSELSEGCLRGL